MSDYYVTDPNNGQQITAEEYNRRYGGNGYAAGGGTKPTNTTPLPMAPSGPTPTPVGELPPITQPNMSWLNGNQGLGDMLQGGLLNSAQSVQGLLNQPTQTMAGGSQFYGNIPWGMAPQDIRQITLSQAQRAFAQPPQKLP